MKTAKGFVLMGAPATVRVAMLLFAFLPFLSAVCDAEQVREEWVVTYNDGNVATAIALDAAENVYITGSSKGDFCTIKYDLYGNQLWVGSYDGMGRGLYGEGDIATAIAVDAAGNVYVAGGSYREGSYYEDLTTIKYDSNGKQLWVTKYNGAADRSDYATAIAVDAAGSVYATGSSFGVGSGTDYATFKYDSNGNLLWGVGYNGTRNSSDGAEAIALDATGNVYVTGYSTEDETGVDYTTIKYDANGNPLWVAMYNGAFISDDYANSYDFAKAIALDAAGNVYVTGHSKRGEGIETDFATVKYDNNGNELWVARYNGPGNGTDVAVEIALDAARNVYVAGRSDGAGTDSDYATIKYDTNGNQLWVARYSGTGNAYDALSAMAVDAEGNVYVTGYSESNNSLYSDYTTVKYDTNGNELWVVQHNRTGNGYDIAKAITVDTAGNVYVTGDSREVASYSDFVTIKYNTTNNMQNDGSGNTHDGGSGLCLIATASNKLSIIEEMWNQLLDLLN